MGLPEGSYQLINDSSKLNIRDQILSQDDILEVREDHTKVPEDNSSPRSLKKTVEKMRQGKKKPVKDTTVKKTKKVKIKVESAKGEEEEEEEEAEGKK